MTLDFNLFAEVPAVLRHEPIRAYVAVEEVRMALKLANVT